MSAALQILSVQSFSARCAAYKRPRKQLSLLRALLLTYLWILIDFPGSSCLSRRTELHWPTLLSPQWQVYLWPCTVSEINCFSWREPLASIRLATEGTAVSKRLVSTRISKSSPRGLEGWKCSWEWWWGEEEAGSKKVRFLTPFYAWKTVLWGLPAPFHHIFSYSWKSH